MIGTPSPSPDQDGTDAVPGARTDLRTFWNSPLEALCAELRCGTDGLRSGDVAPRLAQYGPNSDAPGRQDGLGRAVLRRLLEPLSLILLAAGLVSALTGDTVGGAIIVAILAVSIGLDTAQEGRAVKAADVLRQSVALKAEVRRDGVFGQIDVDAVVPGDVLRVRAGDIVPADAIVLESTAFSVVGAYLVAVELLKPFVIGNRRAKSSFPIPAAAA